MSRSAWALLLAGLVGLAAAPALSGCGGDTEETAYPYICTCNCNRCIEQDPATGVCVSMGRQDFVAPACAADDDEADDACGDACGRFGAECTWDAGARASETPCQ